MKTFEQHLDDQHNTLSDDSKTKVCIIEDMHKIGKLLGWEPMLTKTFDKYYDCSVKELEIALSVIQEQYKVFNP